MKTKAILMMMLAATMSAHAQSQSMEERLEVSDAKANARIDAELNRKYEAKDGIQIRNVKREELDKSLKDLKGNITIQFGNEPERQIKLRKSGGVHVGSGADSLMARTNESPDKPVYVPVPAKARMSITTVGGSGVYCATRVSRHADGSFVRGGASFQEPKRTQDGGGCEISGKPIRLLVAGTYILNKMFGSEQMLVEVGQNEHKVIPLREIVLTFDGNENQKVMYQFFQDVKTSESERFKIILKSFVRDSDRPFCLHEANEFCADIQSQENLAKFASYFSFQEEKMFQYLAAKSPVTGHKHAVVLYSNSLTKMSEENRQYPFDTTAKAVSVYALPGVYGIKWTIDGRPDFDDGIYVQ